MQATSGGEPCLDELEVFSVDGRNVARGAVPTASGTYANNPRHKLEHINDGRYGNDHSWIANTVGRGWVQLVFPESFGHVSLAVSNIDNNIISGQGRRLIGLVDARTGWNMRLWEGQAKAFDAPRMETWDDLRPEHPQGEPKVMSREPARQLGQAVGFAVTPTASAARDGVSIHFKVAKPTDVSLEAVKCLLVDAVRAWRERNARPQPLHATTGQCPTSVML